MSVHVISSYSFTY